MRREESSKPDVERLQPKLLAVAYRMLGTVADAEDAVQDAYLRDHKFTTGQHATEVESPEGWLVRTTTRLCIDRLRTAKREEYIGQWLPEPVPDTWSGAATDRAELAGCRGGLWVTADHPLPERHDHPLRVGVPNRGQCCASTTSRVISIPPPRCLYARLICTEPHGASNVIVTPASTT